MKRKIVSIYHKTITYERDDEVQPSKGHQLIVPASHTDAVPNTLFTFEDGTMCQITDRDLHTIFAALRCYQATGSDEISMMGYDDISSNGGNIQPLSDKEIDLLVERLNAG